MQLKEITIFRDVCMQHFKKKRNSVVLFCFGRPLGTVAPLYHFNFEYNFICSISTQSKLSNTINIEKM